MEVAGNTESPPSNTPRARQGITEVQKKALRSWFSSQQPRPSHAACMAWFKSVYSRGINQSTVSLILSRRYEYLDSGPASANQRQYTPQWVILERALSDWLQHAQSLGESPTSEVIVQRAREIFREIPEYEGQATPQFSPGWLSKFRKRHNIRVGNVPDENAVATAQQSRRDLRSLRAVCGEFQQEDIYNVSETGLFWRRLPYNPFRGPQGHPPSETMAKSRVCLILCTNCTGFDRLPVWMIGHKAMPRALERLNLEAMQVAWRHDKQAWNSTQIMQEWLQAFYNHVQDRRVLLILAGTEAHQTALENIPPPYNVHIQLISLTPVVQQPLDLGIISYLKLCYRNTLLGYIVAGVESGQNPISTMSLYNAVCWITRNWRQDLTHATIYKSFRRSTLLEPHIESFYAPRPPDLTPLYNKVTAYNDSGNPSISLEDYQDSNEESLPPSSFSTLATNVDNTTPVDPDEAEVITPSENLVPSPLEAINAIQTVTRYMQHQKVSSAHDITDLERFERFFNRIIVDQQRQGLSTD